MSQQPVATPPPLAVPSHRDGSLSALKSLLEIVIAALFLVTFVAQPSRIPSESMDPTLRVGDFLLIDKQPFSVSGLLGHLLPPTTVQRGDLVVFHYPVDRSLLFVKRVVGLPGDRLRLRDGLVLINGQPLAEPYAFYSNARRNDFRDDFPSLREADPNVDPDWWLLLRRSLHTSPYGQTGDLTIPPGNYFVLGDNRNDSEDSRYWGFVPRDVIVGRPLLVYFTLRPYHEIPGSRLAQLRDAMELGVHSWRILH